MSVQEPEIIRKGKIEYDKSQMIGYGSEGSTVFPGKYEKRVPVAVKKIPKELAVTIRREIDILCTPETNINVIRYYCREEDENFAYIATELAHFSLETYIEGKANVDQRRRERPLYETLNPPLTLNDKEILQQCSDGLLFIHNQGFVHRNIKPSNYLIVRNRDCTRDLVKLSDFGFSKETRGDGHEFSITGVHGTLGWIAKEILEKTPEENAEGLVTRTKATTAVDIFALGCIFFYVLTKGKHPFGPPLLRCGNIYDGKHDLSLLNNPLAYDLIEKMIHMDPTIRPKLKDVKKHSYFLPDDYYVSTGEYAGLCVIINQRIFSQSRTGLLHGENRYGTDEDRDSLNETFQLFGFQVEIHENLKSYDILLTLEQIASRDLSQYQSLVVCLLSHGNQGVLYGTDHIPVKISDLTGYFQCSKCPGLTGKPKVFIIQACQGNMDQKSRKISLSPTSAKPTDTTDGPRHEDTVSTDGLEDDQDIPEVSDFLQAYATVEGYVSLRDIMQGTIFIRSLCDILREEGNKINLFKVLLRVNNKVADWQNANGFKQMPEIRTCLRKHFLLKREESGFIQGVLDHLERSMLGRIIETSVNRIPPYSYLLDFVQQMKFPM